MRITRRLLAPLLPLCAIALTATGCESAFEVKGKIDTTALDSDRALVVFLAEAPQLDPAGRPLFERTSRVGVLVADAAAPKPSRAFEYYNPGCGAETFAVAAWAPRRLPEGLQAGGQAVEGSRFAPMPGDPVVVTQVLPASCSTSGSQRVDLKLPAPGL